MYRLAAVFPLMLLAAGCAQKNALLNELHARASAIPVVGVCGTMRSFDIVDDREGVAEHALRVPLISRPGRAAQIQAPLSDSMRLAIRSEVERRIGGGSDPVDVRIRITRGLEGHKANLLREQESVEWALEVSLVGEHGNVRALGGMEAFVQSGDASAKFLERLSSEALRLSTAQALEAAAGRMLPEARACRRKLGRPSPAA